MRKPAIEWNKGAAATSRGVRLDWASATPALREFGPEEPGPGTGPGPHENPWWAEGLPPEPQASGEGTRLLEDLEHRSRTITPTLQAILQNPNAWPYPRGGINE